MGDVVVLVERVVDARAVAVHWDRRARLHHEQVEPGPAAGVAVGHREPGDRRRHAELRGCEAHGRLRRDLGEAVGRHQRPVVVSEGGVLGNRTLARGLVDRRGGDVQEGPCLAAARQEPGGALGVGAQVEGEVAALHDGEVEHVVGVVGHAAQLPGQVLGDRLDARRLECAALLLAAKPGEAVDVVRRRERPHDRAGDLARRPGDEDARPAQLERALGAQG